MKSKYIAIWKLHGLGALAIGTTTLELARVNDPKLLTILTTDPGPYFLHIDQSAAIAGLLFEGLLNLFGTGQHATFDERLSGELEHITAKRRAAGVFLVVMGETSAATPNFRMRWDTETLAVCFDAVDKPKIRQTFLPSIQSVLTAVTLSIPANADHQIEQVGEVIYLVEAAGEKPIYSFSWQASAPRLSLSSSLSDAAVSGTATWIPKLIGDKALARPVSLLVTSLDRKTDALQAFLAAWSSLEIFVNATFKATYKFIWLDVMQAGAPDAAKPVFQRVNDVMTDKYRLADKFLVIASLLNTNSAETDAEEFGRLKKIRDDLLHGLDAPTHLPTEAIQNLLFKYVPLHLNRIEV